jgi:hypothetical protein
LNSLEKVNAELRRYNHPLVSFTASATDVEEGVDVHLRLRDSSVSDHTYTIHLAPRDLGNPRFAWAFQKILYDSLHDYIIELFADRP